MSIQSLRELYIDELRDLYSAEQQILQALPMLASAASSAQLKQAFQDHLAQTSTQRERLELIFKQLGESPEGQPCEGMAGLLKEGREHIEANMPPDVKDAALIASAQRVEHYEIAAYGTVRTYARLLGDWESERLLDQTLQEEGDADHLLTHIAQGGINQAAGTEDDTLMNQRWSRLRFVDVDDLDRQQVDYTSVRIRGTGDDDLGTLDGFIIESASGRPFYYVVDSGGWFLGRRYLVPIGQGRFEPTARTLRVDFDKSALTRLPEFSTSAFLAMSDADVRRYERRLLSMIRPEAATSPRYWEAYDRLPEYRNPDWLRTSEWTSRSVAPGETSGTASAATGARRPAGPNPASAPPAARTGQPETELVTARDAERVESDPRLSELSTGVRGIGETDASRVRSERLDDDDRAR